MPELLKDNAPIEVSAEDLRINLAEYLGQVRFADKVVIVKKHNHETAIIISPRMLQRLVDSGRTTREDRLDAFKKLEAAFANIPGGEPTTLEKDIAQAVKQVRAEKRKKKQK
jgi:prevent-host-death family protein